MKFLYCTDLHIKGKNSLSRIDNYYQSCLKKFDEIINISKEKNCDFVICGGDIMDVSKVSNTIVDDIIDRIEASKQIWYIVYGNHDEIGHNKELSKSSSLTHMIRRSKFIENLNEIKNNDLFIKGYNYKHDIETDFKEKGLLIKRTHNEFCIAVPHAFISIKPFFKEVNHICAKDLETNFDLILCSHFHMSFDETINKTRFINPNSIGRTSIREQHQPEILIVDTDTREIEKIKLKSAKPAIKIFDLSKYEETKDSKQSIKDFIASLNSFNWQGIDIRTQIKKVSKEKNVEQKVTDYLFNKIEEIENE